MSIPQMSICFEEGIKMAKINANIKALESKIEKLTTLKSQCEAISVKTNDVVGSGMSIDVIHGIDKDYVLIKEAVIELIGNSISFFENIKSSLVNADNSAANKMNDEGT